MENNHAIERINKTKSWFSVKPTKWISPCKLPRKIKKRQCANNQCQEWKSRYHYKFYKYEKDERILWITLCLKCEKLDEMNIFLVKDNSLKIDQRTNRNLKF